MKPKLTTIIASLLIVNFLSFLIVFLIVNDENYMNKGRHDVKLQSSQHAQNVNVSPSRSRSNHKPVSPCSGPTEHSVEVWGKASIGLYLWEHVLEGKLDSRLGGVWSYGEIQYRNVTFRFRTGPGVIQTKVPQNVENLVLVLNGREAAKVAYARSWLDYLSNYPRLCNIALVILGSESCDNSWLDVYTHIHGGPILSVYMVYDSPVVDGITYHQWPLGVATYRGFPPVHPDSVDVMGKRRYLCNFMGTVYPNSSREALQRVLQSHASGDQCHVKYRSKWSPDETDQSMSEYQQVLQNSDLTLHPVGMNTECYRLYEAMSYGSIPVIEDIMTPGRCAFYDPSAPLRLLKRYDAPVLYLKQWEKDLPNILEDYSKKPLAELALQRRTVLHWYLRFKQRLKRDFFVDITQSFFQEYG